MTDASAVIQYLLEDQPTDQWPADFQVLLFDYLQDLGYKELPDYVPVKLVPIQPLLDQATKMKYCCGDERSKPSYQAEITGYMDAGGTMPPLVVTGKTLLDGRHRLIAMAGKTSVASVIDLADL